MADNKVYELMELFKLEETLEIHGRKVDYIGTARCLQVTPGTWYRKRKEVVLHHWHFYADSTFEAWDMSTLKWAENTTRLLKEKFKPIVEEEKYTELISKSYRIL